MKNSNINKITLRDIYLQYPYKCIDPNLKGVPIPYVKKSDISTHNDKLTFKEWKTIITIYLKHLFFYLIKSGLPYKLPHQMGRLQIRKRKCLRRTNWYRSKKIDKDFNIIVNHKNLHTFGYSPRIKWYRKGINMKYKGLWKFNFLRGKGSVWETFSKELFKDKTLINKYNHV